MDKFGANLDLKKHEYSLNMMWQTFLLNRWSEGKLSTPFLDVSHNISNLDNSTGIISTIFSLASKLNKSAMPLWSQFKKFRRESSKNFDYETLSDFMNSQEQGSGINSMDNISQLIKEIVLNMKTLYRASDSVLIIDDMDRLDPEHIFRLFNIFSAHYDPKDQSNKFGFDKVLFVCDLENIKKMYYHRYGPEVDFYGYINKFYSREPFYFNNQIFISSQIRAIISKLPINSDEKIESLLLKNREDLDFILTMILDGLVKSKQLTIRAIINYPGLELKNEQFKIDLTNIEYVVRFDLLLCAHILRKFFHSWVDLNNALSKLYSFGTIEGSVQLTPLMDYNTLVFLVGKIAFPFVVNRVELRKIDKLNPDSKIFSTDGTIEYYAEGYISDHKILSVKSVEGQNPINPFELLNNVIKTLVTNGKLYEKQ